jgi:hypothetical protein
VITEGDQVPPLFDECRCAEAVLLRRGTHLDCRRRGSLGGGNLLVLLHQGAHFLLHPSNLAHCRVELAIEHGETLLHLVALRLFQRTRQRIAEFLK